MKELLKSGRIKKTRAPPYIVSPLTVAKNSHNKPRLILDLRYVNSFVYKDRIKFDDWRTMQGFVDNKGFLYIFDINEGYQHIDIDENDQKYLGFQKERENMCALKNSVNTKRNKVRFGGSYSLFRLPCTPSPHR